jgi:restriction system protein
MNLFQIFKPMIEQLWWVLPLFILGALLKSSWFKGVMGETMVRLSAKFLLDPTEYRAIHNVTLTTPDGTTQIDHVFVSRFGIFVVETKNYSGWIFGDESKSMWTQKIYKTTYQFQNPLRQNYKHLKALEALLSIPPEKFHSVIVFVGGSTFKTTMPDNVTYSGGYIRYIKSNTDVIFTDAEVEEIYQSIFTGRLKPSFATSRAHIKNVQNRLDPDAPRLCPKCGSDMIQRSVKSGEKAGSKFWGCSQFPKCRTVQNLD